MTTCRKTQSLRHGSFFEKSKLSLQKWLVLLHWWIREYPVTDAAETSADMDVWYGRHERESSTWSNGASCLP